MNRASALVHPSFELLLASSIVVLYSFQRALHIYSSIDFNCSAAINIQGHVAKVK